MDTSDDIRKQLAELKMINDELRVSFEDLMEQFMSMRSVNVKLTEAILETLMALIDSEESQSSAKEHADRSYEAIGVAIERLKESKPIHERDENGLE